jgi:hypothetical protein
MTVLSRGARVRRGGRRPGWLLLTTLLVLAIGASSALVFTNRAELLKLAVILALWAAVVAAFVSVIYRRQSDVDQARVRDLKLIYDLQLDREISARREYELTVESQLRRELASELRAQAADEVAALRAELAALRTNLEILFDAELNQRPALEFERTTVRSYSDWDRDNESLRDRVSRVTSVRAEESGRAEDPSIIDVPEEPLVPPSRPDSYPYQASGPPFHGADTYEPTQVQTGAQWQHNDSRVRRDEQVSRAHWAPPEQSEPAPQPHPQRHYEAPPPEHQQPVWAKPDEPLRRRPPATDWQPVGAGGLWLPPETPGSNPVDNSAMTGEGVTTVSEPRLAAPPQAERRGRHSVPAEVPAESMPGKPVDDGRGRQDQGAAPRPGARHSAGEPSGPEPVARHRSADSYSDPDAPHTGGQSVADLLARLQASPTGGGRRRRRDE